MFRTNYQSIEKEKNMAKINFGGVWEEVVTSEEFPLSKAQEVLKNETVAVLGLRRAGAGPGAEHAGQRHPGDRRAARRRRHVEQGRRGRLRSREDPLPHRGGGEAGDDHPVPALRRGPDADVADAQTLPDEGEALYFSHGFSIVYKEQTRSSRPRTSTSSSSPPRVRDARCATNFLDGSGINSSFAVFQDCTGRATERTLALGIAIGSGYLFPTTFEKEVYSDLTGERGVLMGCLAGVMEAQYNVLRKNGHSPSEAFNETVEELTQSLIRLVAENGMDWMYANCSTTAQRGALDWKGPFRDAVAPVFDKLYESVRSGEETRIVLSVNNAPDYREKLDAELEAMNQMEMWQAGAAVRALRPENRKK